MKKYLSILILSFLGAGNITHAQVPTGRVEPLEVVSDDQAAATKDLVINAFPQGFLNCRSYGFQDSIAGFLIPVQTMIKMSDKVLIPRQTSIPTYVFRNVLGGTHLFITVAISSVSHQVVSVIKTIVEPVKVGVAADGTSELQSLPIRTEICTPIKN